jgi:hypothetical protein
MMKYNLSHHDEITCFGRSVYLQRVTSPSHHESAAFVLFPLRYLASELVRHALPRPEPELKPGRWVLIVSPYAEDDGSLHIRLINI